MTKDRADDQRIAEFLAAVEGDMRRSGAADAEVAAVSAALAEQIEDALGEAGDGASVEAVLRSIDPPTAFSGAPPPATDRDKGRLGIASLAVAIAVAAISFGVLPFAGEDGGAAGPPLFLFGEAAAAILGFFSRTTATGRAGLCVSALMLALFAAAAFFS